MRPPRSVVGRAAERSIRARPRSAMPPSMSWKKLVLILTLALEVQLSTGGVCLVAAAGEAHRRQPSQVELTRSDEGDEQQPNYDWCQDRDDCAVGHQLAEE